MEAFLDREKTLSGIHVRYVLWTFKFHSGSFSCLRVIVVFNYCFLPKPLKTSGDFISTTFGIAHLENANLNQNENADGKTSNDFVSLTVNL